MTLITSRRNAEEESMTLVAEFEAAPERVWNVWEDPRKLERWWGPEPYPATFTRYEFEAGGQCRYYMTGPEDFLHRGWWRIDVLDEPRRIEFVQGLSGDDGEPLLDRGSVGGVITFEPIATGTRMTVLVRFGSVELMEQLAVGMEQGMSIAIGQIDALLEPAHAA
jgi:uncharacterized protein YndB with AHSA1/START domain